MPCADATLPPPRGDSRPLRIVALGVVLFAAAAACHDALRGEFVFDDMSSVVENPAIRRLWPLAEVLAPAHEAGVGGRPLAQLTYALNYAASGDDPSAFRAFSIGLHGVCAALLFGLVRRTLRLPGFAERTRRRALVLATTAASLWAVHPLGTAVVDYVSQRTEALMAASCFAMLYALVRVATAGSPGSRRRWSLVVVAAAIAGMASKETMVVAPVLALLFDRALIAGTLRRTWAARSGLYLALAGAWVVLGALMLASPMAQRGVGFGQGVGLLGYACTSAVTLLRYLKLAAWPDPLVFDYGWAFVRGVPPLAIAGGALAAALVFVAIRWPRTGFTAAALLLLLAPTTSIVPVVQQPIAESRMYLPLAALVVAATVGLHRIVSSTALIAATGAAGLALGTVTHLRHANYRTEIAIWRDTIAKRPGNARAHGNLGAALLRVGRVEESYAASAQAVRLLPNYADAHNNLGIARDRAGRPADAIPHYETALRIAPADARAHYNLGNALAAIGRTGEAITAFERAIRHNPRLAEAHYNLGVLATRAGRHDEAIRRFEAALVARPGYTDAQRSLDRLRAAR